MEKAAKAGGPMEESQRPNLAESRKDLASQQGKAAEQKKTPQATPPMAGSVTLTPRTASVPARGQAPGSALGGRPAPTYRVRFVLRVVSPEASAAGSGVADRAPPSAKPAESKPAAAPVPTAAPAAAPSK
jgi:hypothetical protein